jgi:hypothetical protein
VLGGQLKMEILIIEEDVCTEGLHDFGLFDATKEEDLVHVYAPLTERLDYSHFGGSIPRGNDCNPNWRELYAERQSLL